MAAREAGSHVVAMRALLSTIGSRGDVQPLVALATATPGAWSRGSSLCAARLPRLDRGPWFLCHANRSRAAADDCGQAAAAGPMTAELRRTARGGHRDRAVRNGLCERRRGATSSWRQRLCRSPRDRSPRRWAFRTSSWPTVRSCCLRCTTRHRRCHRCRDSRPRLPPPTTASSGPRTPNGSTACSAPCSTHIARRSDWVM